jgi:hypothetical protein
MPLFLLSTGTLAVETKLATLFARVRSVFGRYQLRNFRSLERACDLHRYVFPNSLNEIGRESGNVARSSCGARASSLCDAQNLYNRKCLVLIAHLMRCVNLGAAMHNRGPEIGSRFGFDFLIEQVQHCVYGLIVRGCFRTNSFIEI